MDLYRQSVGGPPSKVAIKERDQDCPIPSRRSDNHMPQTQINNRQKKKSPPIRNIPQMAFN